MSYQIQYPVGDRTERRYRPNKHLSRYLTGIILFVALLAIAVYIMGVDQLSEYLIPGDNALTVSAFQELQSNIREGMKVRDAVATFCETILNSASVQ